MRNTLSNIMTLGAVIATMTALNIHDALAADAPHADTHGVVVDAHGVSSEHHGGAHHAEVEGLPQLDFTTYSSQIFWMFIFFILLYIFFAKKTLPDIYSAVETRREKVQGDLDNADQLKEETEGVQHSYEEILNEARSRSTQAFMATEDAIKQKTAQATQDFAARSEKAIKATEKSVEKAKDAVMADTESIAAEIASIAAEKIAGIPANVKKAETLIKNINKKAA